MKIEVFEINVFSLVKIKKQEKTFKKNIKNIKSTNPASLPCPLRPLSVIINRSITNQTFCEVLKVAKVIPVFKGGEIDDFSSFCPISLLSPFSKIFEKVLYIRMMKYIKFSLLHDNQFGFREKRKNVDALPQVVEKIRLAIVWKEPSCCVFWT